MSRVVALWLDYPRRCLLLKILLSRAAAAISGTSVDVDNDVLAIAGVGGVVSNGGVVGDGGGVATRSKSLPLLLSNTTAAASFQVGIGLGSISVGAAEYDIVIF